MNLVPKQLLDMFYSEPNFTELEDLSFISQSTDEYVYLLGKCFNKNDLEQIKAFIRSRFWFTYRREFPAIGGTGPTTDVGWGCMLRCGQMLLAQALSVIHLDRGWQWQLNCKDPTYRRLLSMFEDQRSSLFSVHQIAQMGVSEGKPLEEWFGPNTIAQVLKKLVIYDDWSKLAVYVAMHNTIISDEVGVMARLSEKGSAEDSSSDAKWSRPLLIIVPLRLGLSTINECYADGIKEFFKLPQCAGIIGGKPKHAVYFLGQVGNKMLFLDPHLSQNCVDISFGEERIRRRRMKNNKASAANGATYSRPNSVNSPLNVDVSDSVVALDSAPISLCDVTSPTRNITATSGAGSHSERISDKYIACSPNRDNEAENFAKKSKPPNQNDTSIIQSQIDFIHKSDLLTNSSSNSIVDALSSPHGTTPEVNSSISSNPENDGETDYDNNAIIDLSHKEKSRRRLSNDHRTKVQRIVPISSYSMPSSEFSSYTETISDSLRNYEIDNRCTISPPSNFAGDDVEKIEMPDNLPSDSNPTSSLCVYASSSSSTEMLPSLGTMLAQGSAIVQSTNLANGEEKRPPTNFELIASESAEFSNTTTEDERKDEASGESDKLKECDQQKRKVIRQKRKTKRKISNGTFIHRDNLNQSDNEYEDVKLKYQHKITLEKLNGSDLINVKYDADAVNEVKMENGTAKQDESPKAKFESEDKQETELVEDEEDDFNDASYHCSFILSMDYQIMDPSLALAFVCLSQEDYDDLTKRLTETVLPASKPPLFEIMKERPKGWEKFTPYSTHDDSLKLNDYDDFGDPQFDSDDQFELLE